MLFRLLAGVQFAFCFGCAMAFCASRVSSGAEPGAETAPAEASAPNLAATQEAIEMRYRRFEGTLMQLSEYLRKTDPARAELLLRANGRSKEGRIPEQFQHLTDLLKKDQLGDAVERQEMVVADLKSMLELLMSEARKDDLEREKKRIQDLIKDVNKLIGKETDARANTERGGNNSDLQNQQKKVADSTKKLVEKIESQDAAKKTSKNEQGTDSAKKPADGDKKDGEPSEQKPGEQNPDEKEDSEDPDSKDSDGNPTKSDGKSEGKKSQGKKKPGDSESKPDKEKSPKSADPTQDKDDPSQGDTPKRPEDEPKPEDGDDKPQEIDSGKPSSDKPESDKPQSSKPQSGKLQSGKPQSGKPKSGKPQEGKPQEGEQPQESQDQQDQTSQQDDASQKKADKTPGREELERARQEMDRAIEELKKNNKKKASDKQDQAIAELMKAKEKLEEILRQLREEEQELVLAQLEARFRDMLLKQETVNNATLAVNAVPVDNRTDRHRNRSVELARNEDEISLLAAKALTLLKEEGSSVAFPEAVEQIREDMLTVARRLERVDVGEITQNIEQDIVEGLKEIIEAFQKELEKLKDKKQQQQPNQEQQQQQQQQGLVNKLAELKMLRSLQYRVNRRTKQLGRLVEGEQAVEADVVSQLKQLSDRQAKVQKATYDLATGKNE